MRHLLAFLGASLWLAAICVYDGDTGDFISHRGGLEMAVNSWI